MTQATYSLASGVRHDDARTRPGSHSRKKRGVHKKSKKMGPAVGVGIFGICRHKPIPIGRPAFSGSFLISAFMQAIRRLIRPRLHALWPALRTTYCQSGGLWLLLRSKPAQTKSPSALKPLRSKASDIGHCATLKTSRCCHLETSAPPANVITS